MAGEFDWIDGKTSLHLLQVYNGLPVSPCTSSAIGLLLLRFQVGSHHLPTSAPPIPWNSDFTTSTHVICQLVLSLSLFAFIVLLFSQYHAILHLYDFIPDQSFSPTFPLHSFAFVPFCKLVICSLTCPPSPRPAYTSPLWCR